MAEIQFTLPGPDTITLSVQQVNKLIRCGDGDAALLYLYILKTGGKSSLDETMAALGKGLGWINTAMATLSRIGLINLSNNSGKQKEDEFIEETEEPIEYRRHSLSDMKRELEAGSDFSIVAEATEKSLGKILSPDDLMRLFSIYDNLNMPPEVILQLLTYCIKECKRTGGGRGTSLRYVEKTAYTWAREGIVTLERAEEYIKRLEERRSIRGKIKTAMHIRDREFSETEKKYVDKWIVMGFDADAVGIAYDRTIVKAGKLAWPYMDSIMESWHRRGLHTEQEIKDKDGGSSKAIKVTQNANSQRDIAPNRNEIERMQRLLDKTKKG